MDIKEILKNKLSEKELASLKTGYDIIGDIAIMEIPEKLKKRQRDIANAVLEVNRHVRLVCKKASKRKGRLRLREIQTVLSRDSKSTETVHREYGCLFKLDVAKAYFSPRESTERQRIASQVKPKEAVMVMFAGVGAYAIVIGKKQPAVNMIYAIELNKSACEYMRENVKLNRLNYKIVSIQGDVKNKSKPYYGKCDRVAMPLPKSGYKYLQYGIKCLKKHGTIHFYDICSEKELFTKSISILDNECKKLKRKVKIFNKRTVLPYGPRIWKVCIDAKMI